MKSGYLPHDEKCNFVMRRTVRATVWIAWILFDRFSMMVKPERSACEKNAANRFGWWFAEWKRNGQRGRMPNSSQPFRRIFVVKKIRISDLVTKSDHFRCDGSAWTTGYGEQSRSFLWLFDCKNKDLANGWCRSRKTSGFVFGIVHRSIWTNLCFKGMHTPLSQESDQYSPLLEN